MKKFLTMLMCLIMTLLSVTAFTACGPKGAGNRTQIEFRCNATADAKISYINSINAYNNGQGKTDGVYVNAAYSVSSSNLGQAISSASGQTPNVVCISDADFKGYASLGYFLDLDDYMTAEAKDQMMWSDIPELLTNRWCYDNVVDSTIGKRTAGEGASVLGLPLGGNPYLLFYNKALLTKTGVDINIISLSEDELVGTNYKPHGYAEYKVAPADGLKAGVNNSGETVYKVFNNKIPMNWEEFRYLLVHLKDKLNCNYSYFSEYWFEYGYTVGGDCVAWDATQGEYVFTLNDKKANLLATESITVNGTQYNAGDILSYSDKEYIYANGSIPASLYELPSTYQAFLEYNRLGVPKDKTADIDMETGTAIRGYGLAPKTTMSGASSFSSGNSPFVGGFYDTAADYENSGLKGKFDVAPEQQFRAYEGGSLVDEEAALDDIQVKVIGETYGGSVYTGELKTVNGTKIVGAAATTSLNNGICIAKNSLESEYEASFKFASWLAGPEGQKLIAKGNTNVPNQKSIAYSTDFINNSRYAKNAWAVAFANECGDIGDWAYFDEGSWVTAWADMLNTDVREGSKTLTQFFTAKVSGANNALKAMDLRVYRR